MQGWLGDFFRTAWALWYWNARKTLFVLTRRRGQCPCHNPSDTGGPLTTGCEAIAEWRRPERFQKRVCPLLAKNARGHWVCGVAAAQVRPFWMRTAGYYGAALSLAVLVAGAATWGGLRHLGYKVTLAQVFWPPKWGEFRQSRVDLFINQAREHYDAGRIREAIAALSVAYEMDPDNYALGMMLAHFYQAGTPEGADQIYARMVALHPARRGDTVRVWFRSLLARGRLDEVADLAARQMSAEPAQAVPWTHALIFASRHLKKPGLLEAAALQAQLPGELKAVLLLEARMRRADKAQAVALVTGAVLPPGSAYARVHQIERLIELGQTAEAYRRLSAAKSELGGRDVVRLAFATYAVSGNRARLQAEVAALVAPEKKIGPAEVTLLAQHLIRYPDKEVLPQLVEALGRMEPAPPEQRLEIYLNALCAAGSCGDMPNFSRLVERVRALELVTFGPLQRLDLFFASEKSEQNVGIFLPVLQPFGLDLSYAMLDRYRE